MDKNLGQDFKFFPLLKFVMPSIIMMVFMSMYTMVDGAFVSRFVSTDALSAVNIVYPLYSVVIAIAIMLATGGSAIIAKKLGENNNKEAKENFTLIILVGIIIGVIILIIGAFFIEPLIKLLGSNANTHDYCIDYGKTLLYFAPFAMLQILFQYLFVTAGKPKLGLIVTILAGVSNILLDYIFIVKLGIGIRGAALATGIGLLVPSIVGVIYFTFNRNGTLYFVKPRFDFKVLLESCANGSSEMVSNISVAIVTFLFNMVMLRFLGEDGVAAITILLYSQFLLNAIFFGFSMGVAPIISYNYGANNVKRQKAIFKYCMIFTISVSLLVYILSVIGAPTLTKFFAIEGSTVYNIALEGFKIFNISFLFTGLNIFTSTMFTAFSNGKVSAILSFLRTFVFITTSLIVLPYIIGVTGAWLATVIAELLSFFVSIYLILRYKNQYSYL